MMNLHTILLNSARAALTLQDSATGAMPPGHNGPYHDPETPVRNTSHWLITLLTAYSISKDKRFRAASDSAVRYLTSADARPMQATFWHRLNPRKDACNGLMGQAWTLEALALAAEQLERQDLFRLAEQVFLLHPFDEAMALWRRVGVDGSYLSIDMTFNHQLWFATAGALLAHANREISNRVERFLDELVNTLELYPSGLIRHLLPLKRFSLGQQIRYALDRPRSPQDRQYLAYKALGYHSFNLYALALLKQRYPEHPFWSSDRLQAALSYARSEGYWRGLQDNKYGYSYNPPGFEIPFALQVFEGERRSPSELQPQQEQWLSEQLQRCYSTDDQMMNRNTADPATHAARLYEATRLPNLNIQLNAIQNSLIPLSAT